MRGFSPSDNQSAVRKFFPTNPPFLLHPIRALVSRAHHADIPRCGGFLTEVTIQQSPRPIQPILALIRYPTNCDRPHYTDFLTHTSKQPSSLGPAQITESQVSLERRRGHSEGLT